MMLNTNNEAPTDIPSDLPKCGHGEKVAWEVWGYTDSIAHVRSQYNITPEFVNDATPIDPELPVMLGFGKSRDGAEEQLQFEIHKCVTLQNHVVMRPFIRCTTDPYCVLSVKGRDGPFQPLRTYWSTAAAQVGMEYFARKYRELNMPMSLMIERCPLPAGLTTAGGHLYSTGCTACFAWHKCKCGNAQCEDANASDDDDATDNENNEDATATDDGEHDSEETAVMLPPTPFAVAIRMIGVVILRDTPTETISREYRKPLVS